MGFVGLLRLMIWPALRVQTFPTMTNVAEPEADVKPDKKFGDGLDKV